VTVRDPFEGLNEQQCAAVETVRGPVCILAGAGTGKTTTITRRIANQVLSETFEGSQILAVTFTDKAAREMGSRLASFGVRGIRAKTFHAEALAQFAKLSGTSPEIVPSKAALLTSIAQRLPAPYKFKPVRDLASEIERAKNRRITPDRYLDSLNGHEPPLPPDMMTNVWRRYERRKGAMIDFEDLLERTLGVLADPRARSIVHARYAAVTVDEYQDVNLLQHELLEAWMGDRDDLCVVGDDHQAIFSFTGADPGYLLSFPDRQPDAAVVRLEQNYRSTPEILAVANRLAPRLGGSSKTLRTTRAEGPHPELRQCASDREEIDFVVHQTRRLHLDEGIPYERIAVLLRINGRSEEFEEAFAAAGVPFQVRDGAFLRRAAARSVLARLRRERGPVSAAVERVVQSLGLGDAGDDATDEEATRQADLERMLRLAKEFPGDSIDLFAADLRSRFASEDEGRGVVLLTYHAAKGLEFDAVFLPRLEEGELPHHLSAGDDALAEERRLLYVGITRARRHLALSWAAARSTGRRSRPRPSRFLAEILPRGGTGPAPARPPVSRGGGAVSEDPVARALRAWRTRVSRDTGKPAYTVFANDTLDRIAAVRPETLGDLIAISGVGPAKLARFGEEVLAVVKAASV
jgi:DNA helicase-2/ATP-dependent DNA helicase PcrA